MMRVVPLWTGLLVLVLVGLSIPKLFAPSTRVLLDAVRSLGPVSGWRCANVATYVYDPRHDARDSVLLAEPPEALIAATDPGATIERAEVSLRGGDAVVWTSRDGIQHVYVLTPGTLQAVGMPPDRLATCYAHQGAWRIVAEHALQ